MQLTVHIIDAFTQTQFAGNSAAVIITDTWLEPQLMQKIATENNLSETAFLVARGSTHYDIRWFSPITEIDFCGHATLASAFVLFNENGELPQVTISAAAVGDMTIKRVDDGLIEMCFPNRKPEAVFEIPDALKAGLSHAPVTVLQNEQAYFVVYDSEQTVRQVTMVADELKKLAPFDVVITAKGDDYDCVSRYFWPANGGDEDPVTGSIHTGLAPYWAEQLNKSQLVAYQASKRGGVLHCNVTDKNVFISGHAVAYLKGLITLAD